MHLISLKKGAILYPMRSLAHIINPFIADPTSDLHTAQPITFESMRRAKALAKEINVTLFTAQFKEDRSAVPTGFVPTKDLERSVPDMAHFEKPLRLPLLADILERLYTVSDAEYLVYSNVDIGLYPDFYLKVNEFIARGHDAFIINRRRLPGTYTQVSELEKIYTEKGKKHPGFDCFVFHRSLYPKLNLGKICIGVPFVEISFSQNLFALAKNFKLFDDEILTFHLGMEIYKKRAPKEYFRYNQKQFWQLITQLEPDLKKFPYTDYFWMARILRWGLHPCIPIRLVLKLEIQNIKRMLEFKKTNNIG
jgi:hypothetical protein